MAKRHYSGNAWEYERREPYADRDDMLAGYRMGAVLSQDPWGNVTYEARAADGRHVAVKLLAVRAGAGGGPGDRFERLLRVRAAVRHPHLLTLLDWGRLGDLSGWGGPPGDRYFVVSELCVAPTLADMIKAGPLKVAGCLRLLAQLADALEAAHERGLVHRDLAPRSVFVEPRDGGHVWLGDLGLGAGTWRGEPLDHPEAVHELSPEALRDQPLVPQSNVYSLACILVECLTGEPAYASDLGGLVAFGHLAEPPPRPSERRPELPAAIDVVVAAAMADDPEQRLRSPRQFVAQAAEALGSVIPASVRVPSGAPAGGGELPGLRRGWSSRTRRRALRVAVAAVVAVAGASGYVVGHGGDQPRALVPAEVRAEADRDRRSLLRATDATLVSLDSRRAAARRSLATARSPGGQAAFAARLGERYAAAARALPRGSSETAAVESALARGGRAYALLATAARRRDRAAYRAATRAVKGSERDLGSSIAALNGAGR